MEYSMKLILSPQNGQKCHKNSRKLLAADWMTSVSTSHENSGHVQSSFTMRSKTEQITQKEKV